MTLRILLVCFYMVCFCLLNLTAKSLVKQISISNTEIGLIHIILLSPKSYLMGILYLLCALLYLVSLRLMPLSTAGPLFLSLGAIATFFIGVLFFQENFTYIRGIGIGLCIVGIVFLAIR